MTISCRDLLFGWYHQLFIFGGFELLYLEGHIRPINSTMDTNLEDILLSIAEEEFGIVSLLEGYLVLVPGYNQ